MALENNNKRLRLRKGFSSVEEALDTLNSELLRRSKKAGGVPLGPISIDGVRGENDAAKIRAIQEQFDGLVTRLTIHPKRLGRG